MPTSDAVRLRHILDAAREAVAFTEGRSRSDLDADHMLSLALVRLLEIIGEAARGVSGAFRDAHPEVAWGKMAGMRDRLIHGYFDVNLDVIGTSFRINWLSWRRKSHRCLPNKLHAYPLRHRQSDAPIGVPHTGLSELSRLLCRMPETACLCTKNLFRRGNPEGCFRLQL